MPIKFDLTKFPNKYFIETGTYLGEGIEKALVSKSFKEIYSIEIDRLRHISVKEQYTYYDNITVIRGDSSRVLPALLKQINEPCTFWLDAHYMGDDGEYGKKWCPLVEELKAIKNHHIKNHTILIDDYRCMDNMHFDHERNIPIGFPGKKRLMEMLISINPLYNIRFLDGSEPKDVVLARVETLEICQGVIYNLIDKVMEDYPINKFVEEIIQESFEEVIQEIEDETKLSELEERELEILDKETELELRIEEMDRLENRSNERAIELNEREKNVVSKEEYVRLMEAKVNRIDERETLLNEKEEKIKEMEKNIPVIDESKQKDLDKWEKRLIKMEAKIKLQVNNLDQLENELNQKEQELFVREENVVSKESRLNTKEQELKEKENNIQPNPMTADNNKRNLKQRMTRREDKILQMEKAFEQKLVNFKREQEKFYNEKKVFDDHLDMYKNSHNMVILREQLHELDEKLTHRESLLMTKESTINSREEILRVKEETIKDMIFDMALGNELNHIEQIERDTRLCEKKEKNLRERKSLRGPKTR